MLHVISIHSGEPTFPQMCDVGADAHQKMNLKQNVIPLYNIGGKRPSVRTVLDIVLVAEMTTI